ncbi:MAG: FGGY family carbohydrate kinase [Amaricoccus sp.]|uniref:FGGY-family carbohydrate kinase n=1 Tax=Amaricoccus sp. TaxID=1872485 RepID=UPI0039E59525
MTVAVLDLGKTNAKLSAVTGEGEVLEQLATPNRVLPGPPYPHHDLAGLEDWLLASLADLGRRHAIEAIVPCTHGGSGVLIGDDAAALPMIDYEAPLPTATADAYRAAMDDFHERGGSSLMLGAAHSARQLLHFERAFPEVFARARAYLHTPQYWSWRLSGVSASEVTSFGAQSHLWCAPESRLAAIVARRGWQRLLPPMTPAWATLGPIRPEIAAHTGLSPDTRVICGIHDSSANFYRYQAAGLADLTVISTGTWIVALTDRQDVDFTTERAGWSCNSDVHGRPVPGMLTMGGREFSAVAGGAEGPADRATLARLVESGTMALPFFGQDDGLAPGRAGKGRVIGPMADDPAARFSLAVLYAALLTAEILDALPDTRTVVLDGNFVRDPLYGALVQHLHPGAEVCVNSDSYGASAGAALLAGHAARTAPAALALARPDTAGLPDLAAYRARWREALTAAPEGAQTTTAPEGAQTTAAPDGAQTTTALDGARA